jgi:hypothetical protein
MNLRIAGIIAFAIAISGSAWCQTQAGPGQNVPLYRVTVIERTVKPVNYQYRSGPTQIDFRGTGERHCSGAWSVCSATFELQFGAARGPDIQSRSEPHRRYRPRDLQTANAANHRLAVHLLGNPRWICQGDALLVLSWGLGRPGVSIPPAPFAGRRSGEPRTFSVAGP